MKLSFMNTHRVGENSLEPYRSTESSPKQCQKMPIWIKQVMQLKKWQERRVVTVGSWGWCLKLSCMNTHRVDQKSVEPYINPRRVAQNSLEPCRPSKSSHKQSKSADMDQTGYAIEKVTRIVNFDC